MEEGDNMLNNGVIMQRKFGSRATGREEGGGGKPGVTSKGMCDDDEGRTCITRCKRLYETRGARKSLPTKNGN